MLTNLIYKIQDYFYKPQIGDVYYRDMKPSFLFDPWECETIRKQDIIIDDIKEGYIKYKQHTNIHKIIYTEVMPIKKFKSYFTRRI